MDRDRHNPNAPHLPPPAQGRRCNGFVPPRQAPGWPCQCGHYRHDDGFCSGTLGTMLDLDGLTPDEDRSVPCACSRYLAADEDWARAVGFISERF